MIRHIWNIITGKYQRDLAIYEAERDRLRANVHGEMDKLEAMVLSKTLDIDAWNEQNELVKKAESEMRAFYLRKIRS